MDEKNNWTALSLVLALCAVPLTGLSPVADVPSGLTAVAEETANIPAWDGTYDTSWFDANETEFHLTTPEQYAGFVKLQNQGVCEAGQTFYLDTDIDFNGQSIDVISKFAGTFDGNGHTLRNLIYTVIASQNGTIKNIYLEFTVGEVSLAATASGIANRGLLCSANGGTIENCHISGTVEKIYMKSYKYTTRAYNMDIAHYYHCYFGCLCGANYGKIQNCTNSVNVLSVNPDNSSAIGGICGFLLSGTISECGNQGSVKVYTNGFCGGICGQITESGKIYSCKNSGTLSSPTCGGIVGYSNCVNKAGNPIASVYNVGVISGKATAGICGEYYAGSYTPTIVNAYHAGMISSGSDNAIARKLSSDSAYCYYCNSTNYGGYGSRMSEDEMKTKEFAELLGEDFIYVEGDFPHLKWESVEFATTPKSGSGFDKTEISLTEYGQKETLTLQNNVVGSVTYVSTNTSVATVDENGTVTAVGDGTATIYAIFENTKAECTVTVKVAHTLSESAISMEEGDSKSISVISTETGQKDTALQVTFVSSDESIATVNQSGEISGVSEGNCQVIAIFGQTSLTCQVTVTPKTQEPTTESVPSSDGLFGDIDGDGNVNATDASYILQYTAYVGAGYDKDLHSFMEWVKNTQN